MTDNNRDKLCREFTELTGGHWHEIVPSNKYGNCLCSCGEIINIWNMVGHCKNYNSYTNPADVLRVIEKFDWSELFMAKLVYGFEQPNIEGKDWDGCIPVGYIIEPDALLKAAVEWLKEKK